MTIYIAEIKGRGVAAFHAETAAVAQRFVCDLAFCDDLMSLTADSLPLWDGVASILIREAKPPEEDKWFASRAKAVRQGNIEVDDPSWIAYLVALADPGRRRPR
jgi:hypothetical protein